MKTETPLVEKDCLLQDGKNFVRVENERTKFQKITDVSLLKKHKKRMKALIIYAFCFCLCFACDGNSKHSSTNKNDSLNIPTENVNNILPNTIESKENAYKSRFVVIGKPFSIDEMRSFVGAKWYSEWYAPKYNKQNQLIYNYTSPGNVKFPLKTIDIHRNEQYIQKDDWKWFRPAETDCSIALITQDSFDLDRKYPYYRLINIAEEKAYYFEKIDNQIQLTCIEPLEKTTLLNFFAQFVSDPDFRMKHIKFPIYYCEAEGGMIDSVLYTRNNWNECYLSKQYRFTNTSYILYLCTDELPEKVYINGFYHIEGGQFDNDLFLKAEENTYQLTEIFTGMS